MTTTRIQAVNSHPGEHATFIVLGIREGEEAIKTILNFAANFSALTRSMNTRFTHLRYHAVFGISSSGWDRLFPGKPKPKELVTFKEIKGPKYTAVSTPGDLFFHLRGDRQSMCYEVANIINEQLREVTTPIEEVHGFRYFDGRSILEFVDGTEDPEHSIAGDYTLVGDEDPDFKGGSYVFIQKYIHDMQKWRALSDEEQENVIGRKKFNDVELSDAVKPPTAHNAVSKAHDAEGNELKIMRANMPFAYPSRNEYGTFFVGYAGKFSTTHQMLKHMFQGDADGNLDRILDFSTAKTGTLFFVPTLDFLDDLGD